MPTYDAVDFDPAAPVACVALRNPIRGASVSDIPLLLDTGADITLLPRPAVERLGVPALPGQHYELMGFDGSKSFAPVVIVDLIFLQRAFRGRYLLIEADRGILGRDILNHRRNCPKRKSWSGRESIDLPIAHVNPEGLSFWQS